MSSSDDDMITCPICMEDFDELTRLPKLLPCDHTFCIICLQSVVKDRNLECPFCREKYDLGKYGPKSLLNNSRVMSLLNQKRSGDNDLDDSVQIIEYLTSNNSKGNNDMWCLSCENFVSVRCTKKSHLIKNLIGVMEFRRVRLGCTLVKCQDFWVEILRNKLDARTALIAAEQAALQMLDDITANFGVLDTHVRLFQAERHVAESLTLETLQNTELSDKLASYESKLIVGKEEFEKSQNEADQLKRLNGYSIKTTLIAPDGTTKELPQFDLALKVDQTGGNSHLISLLTYTLLRLTEEQRATQSSAPAECPPSNVAPNPSQSERSVIAPETSNTATSGPSTSSTQEVQTWVGARPKTLPPRLEKARLEALAKAKKPTITAPPVKPSQSRPLAPCKAPGLPRLACAFVLGVNACPRGRVVFDLRPDVAPIMCQKVAALVMGKGNQTDNGEPTGYKGARIWPQQTHEAVYCSWPEVECERFQADTSTLRNERGSVRLRIKGKNEVPAGSQQWNVLVDCEWIICLRNPDKGQKVHRFTTVFAHVTEGLDLLDRIKEVLDKGPMAGTVTVEDCYMI